jgi:hypothetical protein
MPRLLLLVPTTSYRISDFLGAARRLDVEVTVGSNRRQVLEKFSPGRTVTLDVRNSEKGTKQIIDFARRYPLQAIVAVDEDTTVLAAKASEALGLPHNSPSSVGAAANKYRFRTVLAEAGLPSPGFTVVSREDDPAERRLGWRFSFGFRFRGQSILAKLVAQCADAASETARGVRAVVAAFFEHAENMLFLQLGQIVNFGLARRLMRARGIDQR